MRRIYVSTVGRGKQLEESSKVYCIDFDTEKILGEVRLPLAMFDLKNPRGGCRGGRGLTFHADSQCLFAAGFDGIFVIDPNSMFVRAGYWSQGIQDIHQIYPLEDKILITNTMHNKLATMKVGKGWEFRHLLDLNQYRDIGRPPPTEGHPDHLHLNSCIYEDKLALICRTGKILNWETGEVLCDNPEYLEGSHDLVRIKTGEICVNNSRKHRVVAFNDKWEPRVLCQLGEGPRSALAAYGWVRGMSYLEKEDILLCGNAPAEVLVLTEVSTSSPKLRKIPISDEIVETVFDVVPHPEDWK